MSYVRNHRKPWTKRDVSQVRMLARQNTPLRVIGFKMGRSESAIRTKASSEGISLKPSNQRPYASRT